MDKLFEDVVDVYLSCGSMKQVAKEFNISLNKVRKILVTMNAFESEKGDWIKSLYDNGTSIKTIMKETGLSRSAVDTYLPYERGPNNSNNPTKNALAIRACRERKRKCD